MTADLRPKCEADCGNAAVTTFTANTDTLNRLGLPQPLDGKPSILRVCAGCYLAAMSLMLDRAGLPRQQPLAVEYWCKLCDKVIPLAEVKFIGPTKVTAVHEDPARVSLFSHGLQIRPVRATATVDSLTPPVPPRG